MYTWDYRRPDNFSADMQNDWNQTIMVAFNHFAVKHAKHLKTNVKMYVP